jgi:hypothetical protein
LPGFRAGPSFPDPCATQPRHFPDVSPEPGNGTWVVKASNGHGAYWTKAFAEADDFDNADGKRVLDYFNARDLARKLARGDDETSQAPVTVDQALKDYARDDAPLERVQECP